MTAETETFDDTEPEKGDTSPLVGAVESAIEGKAFEAFKIESLDDLKHFMMVARGQDPDSQQTINKFMNFEDEIERSNLPSTSDVIRIAYFDFLSALHFPNHPENPCSLAARKQAKALMARKGEKSKQFVDLMKQTPSMVDLQSLSEGPAQRGLIDRALGRGKSE